MNPRQRPVLVLGGLAILISWSMLSRADSTPPADGKRVRIETGKELFTREWLPNDKRSFAGDGLGPMHNARSCVACHRQGGVGGAGANGSNATVVQALVNVTSQDPSLLRMLFPPTARQPDREKLAEIHPALRTENSFPLHRFSLADKTADLPNQTEVLAERGVRSANEAVGNVRIDFVQSERNTPALFGSGLIDRIPESVLEAVAAEQAKLPRTIRNTTTKVTGSKITLGDIFFGHVTEQRLSDFAANRSPLPVAGRVSRLKDGKAGRFGWKANVATLHQFTLQACSSELGLEVPGFPRAAPRGVKNYKAPGLDLSAEQCASLSEYVASLPRPIERVPETKQHGQEIAAGKTLFASMGCAVCHRPKLGDVDGIYSDLLLHDMGPALGGQGSYGSSNSGVEFVQGDVKAEPVPVLRDVPSAAEPATPKLGAGAREWRTPPLWGLQDSGPYLHDGRANTIAEAIVMHDGEGAESAQAFETLSPREKMQLDMFLQSLASPDGRP